MPDDMARYDIQILMVERVLLTWRQLTDARPDYAPKSTDDRMKRSVIGGLQNIQTYINPEVIITQGRSWEDSFFWDGVEVFSQEHDIPHVGLSAASRDLMWIASLDSQALRCRLSSLSLICRVWNADLTCNSVE